MLRYMKKPHSQLIIYFHSKQFILFVSHDTQGLMLLWASATSDIPVCPIGTTGPISGDRAVRGLWARYCFFLIWAWFNVTSVILCYLQNLKKKQAVDNFKERTELFGSSWSQRIQTAFSWSFESGISSGTFSVFACLHSFKHSCLYTHPLHAEAGWELCPDELKVLCQRESTEFKAKGGAPTKGNHSPSSLVQPSPCPSALLLQLHFLCLPDMGRLITHTGIPIFPLGWLSLTW